VVVAGHEEDSAVGAAATIAARPAIAMADFMMTDMMAKMKMLLWNGEG
jgi:hypothetical protein